MKEHKVLKVLVEKIVAKNVNSACIFWVYQPKIPEKATEKYKK